MPTYSVIAIMLEVQTKLFIFKTHKKYITDYKINAIKRQVIKEDLLSQTAIKHCSHCNEHIFNDPDTHFFFLITPKLYSLI